MGRKLWKWLEELSIVQLIHYAFVRRKTWFFYWTVTCSLLEISDTVLKKSASKRNNKLSYERNSPFAPNYHTEPCSCFSSLSRHSKLLSSAVKRLHLKIACSSLAKKTCVLFSSEKRIYLPAAKRWCNVPCEINSIYKTQRRRTSEYEAEPTLC